MKLRKARHLVEKLLITWRLPQSAKAELSLDQFRALKLSRVDQYAYCILYFDRFIPRQLREHRRYFSQEGRGFGEDAFHSMWYLLFKSLRPHSALEIGVYRGQTISLWKLISKTLGFECQVGCITPLTSVGDSIGSYSEGIDYYEDVLLHHRHFRLDMPEICREFSTSPAASEFIGRRKWDVIYIDGNHDYEIAREDWARCSRALSDKGIIVLDDSALGTDFTPPSFSTAGHPGPSRVAREIPAAEFEEILAVGHNRVFGKRKSR